MVVVPALGYNRPGLSMSFWSKRKLLSHTALWQIAQVKPGGRDLGGCHGSGKTAPDGVVWGGEAVTAREDISLMRGKRCLRDEPQHSTRESSPGSLRVGGDVVGPNAPALEIERTGRALLSVDFRSGFCFLLVEDPPSLGVEPGDTTR